MSDNCIRLDPKRDRTPQAARVGFWALRVLEHLYNISAQYELGGRLGPQYRDVAWLAMEWSLREGVRTQDGHILSPEAILTQSIDRLLRERMLAEEGEELVLAGWEKVAPKPTSTARVKEWRQKKRAERQAETGEEQEEPSATGLTPAKFLREWNLFAQATQDVRGKKLPQCRGLGGQVLEQVRARCKELTPEELHRVLYEGVAKDSFYLGQNDRGWVADIRWAARPMKLATLLEKVDSGRIRNNHAAPSEEVKDDLFA